MENLNELGKTEQELASGTFHLRLLKYVEMSTTEEEYATLNDETVLYFEMIDGRYCVSFNDLKEKADAETLEFLDKNKITFQDINKTQDGEENND